MSDKKYGLILSEKKKSLKFQASRNVFGNDSDSEEETSKKPVLLRPSDLTKRQAKKTQEKAVSEDPTVYQYDEIYEEMVGAKEKETSKIKEDKKPRYIENLIKSANKRKIENERRMERQIQKEREQEGEEFKDKEVFVTSAYKKKLEELREEEEKEKREEYLESIGDVTKQSDLGGFYRHLYEQKLGKEKSNPVKKETTPDKDISEDSAPRKDKIQNADKKRNYRKRKSPDAKHDLSEGEIEESDDEINRLNLENIRLAKKNKKVEENIDADSDFSVDDPSDEETSAEQVNKKTKSKGKIDSPARSLTPEIKPEIKPVLEEVNAKLEKEVKTNEKKPPIDIWKKRTVGDVFDQALKRYYERKASRGI